jgi:hypothetical protein
VVTYLMDTFGQQKMDKVLGLFQKGTPLDTALTEIYGMDTQGIDDAWHTSMGYAPEPGSATQAEAFTATPLVIPTLALWTAEVAQAVNTATPAPICTLTTAPPAATLTVTKILATADNHPAPIRKPGGLPGWVIGAGVGAGAVVLAVLLFLIIRIRIQKGG